MIHRTFTMYAEVEGVAFTVLLHISKEVTEKMIILIVMVLVNI